MKVSGKDLQNIMTIQPQRVMIFVDDANFTGTAWEFGRQPDLLALQNFLANPSEGRGLVEMVVYIGFPPQWKEEHLPQEWKNLRDRRIKRRDFLEFHGIMTVPWFGKDKGEKNDKGERLFSANVDVLMAMDAMEFAFEVKPDIVVLVSGDQDFSYLATKLRRRGIRVEAASMEQNIHPELKKAVNSMIDLTDFFNTLDVN